MIKKANQPRIEHGSNTEKVRESRVSWTVFFIRVLSVFHPWLFLDLLNLNLTRNLSLLLGFSLLPSLFLPVNRRLTNYCEEPAQTCPVTTRDLDPIAGRCPCGAGNGQQALIFVHIETCAGSVLIPFLGDLRLIFWAIMREGSEFDVYSGLAASLGSPSGMRPYHEQRSATGSRFPGENQ